MKCAGDWMVFMLKDRYATDFEKSRLRQDIVSALGMDEGDIMYAPFEKGVSLSYYFFVRERTGDEPREIMEMRGDMFDRGFGCVRITGKELSAMTRDSNCDRGYVKQGDVVMLKGKDKYGGLYGVVLRVNRNGKIDVGMKFCFGKVVVQYDKRNLQIMGNVFNYIKVLD